MNNKKNLDRLFQENFKDFETTPEERVWKNIASSLQKDKNKRVIPLWWFKLGGVAAVFLLGFWGIQTLQNNAFSKKNVTVLNQKSIENTANQSRKLSGVVVKTNSDKTSIKNQENQSGIRSKGNENGLSETNLTENKNSFVVKNNTIPEKTLVKNQKGKTFYNSKKGAIATILESKKENKKTTNNKIINQLLNEKEVVALSKNNTNQNTVTDFSNKKAITENTIPEKTAVVPNELEQILKKQDEDKNKKVVVLAKNKWQITSNVAPVFMNSTSNGSPIDSKLANNSKSYQNSLSYGVGVNYAVNKKLTVRTGINKVSLGYQTNDVAFSGSLANSSSSLQNVPNTTAGLAIQPNTDQVNAVYQPFERAIQTTNNGSIEQKMGYYEVPLEVSYAVLDKKFGVTIIGGLSTLFLNENQVSITSANTSIDLGKVSNLNNVHYSTNIGLGFSYKFTKTIQVNFEPTFKYQLNTYSSNNGNFKPYFIGLYSGLRFNF